MTEKPEEGFIDGETRTSAQIAAELLPILAMWGVSRNTARRAAAALATTLAGMSDDEYSEASQGLRIKAGKPQNASEAN